MKGALFCSIVLVLLAGCSTHAPTRPGGWNLAWFSQAERSYRGPALPAPLDVAQLEPNFPPGRQRWVNALARLSHRAPVFGALEEPHGFLASFPARPLKGDRSGVLVLHNGTRLDYLVRGRAPEWLHLRFPSGGTVALEVPIPEEEGEED